MTLRAYIILILVATFSCYLALLAVIYFFNPSESGSVALALFYISLALALTGTFSLVGLLSRLIFTSEKLMFKKVITSFRQGIWFSLLICILLYLNKIKMLEWKYVIIPIIAFALLELFFLSYKAKPNLKI
ncbi:MAG: hypothetical protein NTZ49_03415 [Candidatus Parcubacteria bacterium]|nr:hypothetical protein [Candidatus Parcubacteria bacterium]